MQALDHDRLRDVLLDQLAQPHARDRRQRGLGRGGQRRQDERNHDDDELSEGCCVHGLYRLFEELADGSILVHAQDRLGEQWRNRQDFYLGMLLRGWQRDRIRDHDLLDRRVDQLLDRVPRQHAVGGEHPNAGRTLSAQRVRNADQGAASRDQVIDDHRVHAVDVTDHPLLAHDVVLGAAFVDKGDRQIEQPRDAADPLGAADVGRDDDGIGQVQLADVLDQELFGRQVIDGDIKKALDGVGVQVERDDAVRPGQRDDVGHQLGTDGVARLGLFFLARIAVVAHDGGNPARRGAPPRIENYEQLDVILRARLASWLGGKKIAAPDPWSQVYADTPGART